MVSIRQCRRIATAARRGERRVGNIEGGLSGVVQQAGLAVAGKYIALDTNDCGDVEMPVGAGELVDRTEDGAGAALVAVAASIVTVIGFERRRGFGDRGDLLEQGRLVVLDPRLRGGRRWTISATLALAATSKCFLTVQRIEGDNCAGRKTEFGQQRLGRRDLVGLLGDVDMGEHEGGIDGERAQHQRGGTVMEIVEASPPCFAVERDAGPPGGHARGLQQAGMMPESCLDRGWIEPFEDIANGGVRRRAAPLQTEGRVQPAAMGIDEGDDTAIRIAPVTMARIENSSTWGSS